MSTNPRPVSTTTPPTSRATATRRPRTRRPAFTLTEIMIVVAIIAILAVVVAWAGSRVLSDAKVKQTRAALETINSAITAYLQNQSGAPPRPTDPDDPGNPFIATLPPGSDGFRIDFFREPDGSINTYSNPVGGDPPAIGDKQIVAYSVSPDSSTAHYKPDSRRIYGIQSLYYFLAREPSSKQILAKLPPVFVAKGGFTNASGQFVPCSVAGEMGFQDAGAFMARGKYNSSDTTLPTRVTEVPILLDAWGRPLYYDADARKNNDLPAVQSAGPDGKFGNEDDIFSYGG